MRCLNGNDSFSVTYSSHIDLRQWDSCSSYPIVTHNNRMISDGESTCDEKKKIYILTMMVDRSVFCLTCWQWSCRWEDLWALLIWVLSRWAWRCCVCVDSWTFSSGLRFSRYMSTLLFGCWENNCNVPVIGGVHMGSGVVFQNGFALCVREYSKRLRVPY